MAVVTPTVQDPSTIALQVLEEEGFNFFAGVADSLLATLIARLSRATPPRYIPAVREDTAIGLAAGAYLGGQWPCVFMQNSGFGYSLNALTSLNLIYDIPTLLIIGYRGYQGKDAPEHLVMGRACEAILREIGIPAYVPNAGAVGDTIRTASCWMRTHHKPAAILIRQGVLTHDHP